MSKSSVYILNFKVLYNIIFEIKNSLNFNLYDAVNVESILEQQKKNHNKCFVVITNEKIIDEYINNKQIIAIESYPLNLLFLVEKINSNLLMQQYDFQSNISVKDYMLNLNSRTISTKNNKLKLTEREIQIILYLKEQEQPKNINVLQKEVWGYVEDLETHTVETHIYRLRKKLKKTFDDQNFIKSGKNGYLI